LANESISAWRRIPEEIPGFGLGCDIWDVIGSS
jgi:hypothetical protein